MTIRQDLIKRIDSFIADHGITATDLGLKALNDGSFVTRLRAGKDIRISTVERVTKWMDREEKKALRRQAVAA